MVRIVEYILAAVLALLGQQVLAQGIAGTVVEHSTNQPVPYATVILNTVEDASFIQGTTTDDNGRFMLEQEPGTYKVEVSFMGYKTIDSLVILKDRQLLNFSMKPDETALSEVVVTAEKTTIQQLIDKKVINVGKDLLSSGGDATTVLDQLAEVQIDQEGNVSLLGSGNVNVLVNGKPSPLSVKELLQQIPASQMQKIELITSPSAKYQANGLTGILNIITEKKVQEGLAASFNATANTLGGLQGSANATYGVKKFNYKVGVNYNKNIFENTSTQARTGSAPYTQETAYNFDGNILGVNAGLDYFPDDKNEFSLGLDLNNNTHDLENIGNIERNGEVQTQNTFGMHDHKTYTLNTNYRHSFSDESYFEVDAQISDNINVLESDLEPNIAVLDNSTDNDVVVSSVAADFASPLGKKLKLEAGALWTREDLNNARTMFNDNETVAMEERFRNEQNTYAVYSLLKYRKDKWGLQAGLRGEVFTRKADLITDNAEVDNTYTNLFPSLHASYELTDSQSFTLGYNRRTSRPALYQVNPIAFQINEFSVNQGNPNLEPEFSNNVFLSYSLRYKKFNVYTSTYASSINNVIAYTNTLSDAGVQISSPVNEGSASNVGFNVGLQYNPFNWWDASLDFNANFGKIKDGSQDLVTTKSSGYNTVFRNQFKILPSLRGTVSYNYSGDSKSYNSEHESNQALDLGVRYQILKGQGNINLRVTDVFNTRVWNNKSFGQGFTQTSTFKPVSRVAYLSFSYRLDGKVRQRNQKDRDYKSGIID